MICRSLSRSSDVVQSMLLGFRCADIVLLEQEQAISAFTRRTRNRQISLVPRPSYIIVNLFNGLRGYFKG
jgi:hypothetical protein